MAKTILTKFDRVLHLTINVDQLCICIGATVSDPETLKPITLENVQQLQLENSNLCGIASWIFRWEIPRIKQVIHGDLAARNILLNENYIAKMGDFGFSRQLLYYENYKKNRDTPLPWKWLAIESLKDMDFSVKSDVWAFGVTLWEIFSLGQVPYPCWNYTEEFLTWLDKGNRMSSPQFANKEIYNLMLACCQDNPKSRFEFSILASRLKKLLSDLDPN